MSHAPKPWLRPSRKTWYVEIDKEQHRLGDHPADLPPPKKRKGQWDPPRPIIDEFYWLMAERPEGGVLQPAHAGERTGVQ